MNGDCRQYRRPERPNVDIRQWRGASQVLGFGDVRPSEGATLGVLKKTRTIRPNVGIVKFVVSPTRRPSQPPQLAGRPTEPPYVILVE